MNDMPYRYLTPPAAAPGNVAERFFGRLMSLMVWALLATMGVVFARFPDADRIIGIARNSERNLETDPAGESDAEGNAENKEDVNE